MRGPVRDGLQLAQRWGTDLEAFPKRGSARGVAEEAYGSFRIDSRYVQGLLPVEDPQIVQN